MDFLVALASNIGVGLGLVVSLLLLAFWVVNRLSIVYANHSLFAKRIESIEAKGDALNETVSYLKGNQEVHVKKAESIESKIDTLSTDFAFLKGFLQANLTK